MEQLVITSVAKKTQTMETSEKSGKLPPTEAMRAQAVTNLPKGRGQIQPG